MQTGTAEVSLTPQLGAANKHTKHEAIKVAPKDATKDATKFATKKVAKPAIAPDWWSKTLAGVILGFSLSLGLVGLFAWLGPGGIHALEKSQFVMWMITPIWMLILSFIYLCRGGLRAILYLLVANGLVHTLLYCIRH
jgi:hypothetical protein